MKTLTKSVLYGFGTLSCLTIALGIQLHNYNTRKLPTVAAAVAPYQTKRERHSAGIDTITLKQRIAGDWYLLENQVAHLRSAAAENNPNGLAVVVLKPYMEVEQDISRRIEAREDTLRRARGSQ